MLNVINHINHSFAYQLYKVNTTISINIVIKLFPEEHLLTINCWHIEINHIPKCY